MFFPLLGWQAYVNICLVLMVLYYAVITLYYFRTGIFKPNRQIANSHQPHQKEAIASELPFPEKEITAISKSTSTSVPDLSITIHNLTTELNALMEQSSASKVGKTNLQQSIHQLMKKYEMLNGSGFESAVLNLIAALSESHCNVHFTAEELAAFRI